MAKGNLWHGIPQELPEELFTTLLLREKLKVERIVSRGQCSPEGFWYDQEQGEWIVLLKGAAQLRFEKDSRVINLGPGDFVDIGPHVKHRVEWTDPEAETVWLAVFYG